YFERSLFSRRLLFRRRLFKSTTRSARHGLCPRWPFLSPSQSSALRHYHRRTASVEGGRNRQPLHSTVFRADERSLKGRRYRHLLAAHLSTDNGRNKSNPSRLSQSISECVRMGDLRPRVDHDGNQRAAAQA